MCKLILIIIFKKSLFDFTSSFLKREEKVHYMTEDRFIIKSELLNSH